MEDTEDIKDIVVVLEQLLEEEELVRHDRITNSSVQMEAAMARKVLL